MRHYAWLAAIALTACGGGNDEAHSSCWPEPSIASSPVTSVSASQQYRYHVEYTMACIPIFTRCAVELLEGPSGSGVDPVLCGKRATQSWSVAVGP
jgi:hypothetical protein